MESFRKSWNKQQSELRRIMLSYDQHHKAIDLFLNQHAVLHAAKTSQSDAWSFEDEVLNDMTEEQIQHIAWNSDHSIAWLLWHIARIEDVAMNMLVAGSLQILHRENWLGQMKIAARDTGNEMDGAGGAGPDAHDHQVE